MKLRTPFIRAAVEGATIDGRAITAEQIDQMGASYDPNVYNAKISLEHLRGFMPDGVFKSLGDVVEVMTDTIKEGALKGKRALYVKMEPHQDLINMVRNGQKTHLSIEMHPRFPTTGGAYLFGVGVTDSPASLGTGIMQFSAGKQPEHTFSDPMEADLAIPVTEVDSSTASLFKATLDELRSQRDEYKSDLQNAKTRIKELEAEVDELKGRIPDNSYIPRPKTTGAELDFNSKTRF